MSLLVDNQEKIIFHENLWVSITTHDQTVSIAESHVRELDSRFARHGTSPSSLLSLQELQQKLAPPFVPSAAQSTVYRGK